MTGTPFLELRGIRRTFGSTVALDGIDLDVGQGEFVALLGPSGCGKTTLLRIVAGLEYADQGQVRLGGREIDHLAPERRPTNLVFQRGALFPHMSVVDNICYPLRRAGEGKPQMRERSEELIELVGLTGLADRRPSELSGGQAQRVALARALAAAPEVLLLDEPLAALDLKLRKRLQLELRALQRRLGTTFVLVTHDQEESLVVSDRIVVMDQGRIEQIGTPEEIYRTPGSAFVSQFIGETNLLTGVSGEGPGQVRIGRVEPRRRQRRIVRWSRGRALDPTRGHRHSGPGPKAPGRERARGGGGRAGLPGQPSALASGVGPAGRALGGGAGIRGGRSGGTGRRGGRVAAP